MEQVKRPILAIKLVVFIIFAYKNQISSQVYLAVELKLRL